MPTPRRPVQAARLHVFPLPSAPASLDEAFDATGAAIAGVIGETTLLRGADVYLAVLRGTTAEVWRMSGIPAGLIPEDDLVRAVVCASDVPADTVVCVRRFAGLDPQGRDAVGLRFFLERAGERAWAVLHFHEVGTPRPAEPRFPKARVGPTPPGQAWLGVPPDPAVGLAFDAPN